MYAENVAVGCVVRLLSYLTVAALIGTEKLDNPRLGMEENDIYRAVRFEFHVNSY